MQRKPPGSAELPGGFLFLKNREGYDVISVFLTINTHHKNPSPWILKNSQVSQGCVLVEWRGREYTNFRTHKGAAYEL